MKLHLRCDRLMADLPKKAKRADGAMLYHGVLVTVGEALQYGHGTEYPSREALTDAAYLDALTGISIVDERAHSPYEAPDVQKEHESVYGHIRKAWFDEENDCVRVEVVVFHPKLIADIDSGKVDLSESYHAELDEIDGKTWQVRRQPVHASVVDRGRSPTAHLRADSEVTMTEEQIRALFAELLEAHMASMEEKAKEAMEAAEDADEDEDEADMAAKIAKLEAENAELRADMEKYKLRADAAEDAQLVERAKQLGVSLPATSTPKTRLTDLVKALGVNLRADSADDKNYLMGIVDTFMATKSVEQNFTQVSPDCLL